MVIHFDFDKYEILRRDEIMLGLQFNDETIDQIKSIELYGHCDFVGNHAYNDALSRKRVEQTKAWLVQKGINENVISITEGFGKRQPLNDNASAQDRFDNRRVEIVVKWETLRGPGLPLANNPHIKKDTTSFSERIKDTAKIKAGTTVILRNIQFIPGRHYLLPESLPILDELYKALVDYPTLVIEIQGHVCCTPDNEDGYDLDNRTLDLSLQRARVIYEHLIERGIASSRLSYKGFGGSRKLHRFERNDFERQENRRVELRIVSR